MEGRKVAFWIVLGLALGYCGAANAQEFIDQDDTKARLERLERQNRELIEIVRKLQGATSGVSTPPAAPAPAGTSGLTETDVQKIVGDYLKTVEEKKAQEVGTGEQSQDGKAAVPATQTEEGYRVGTLMGMTAKWESSGSSGYGLWIKTPNSDFTMHPGFWMHYDNVFWDQSNLLRLPQGGNAGLTQKGNPQKIVSGDRLGGIGDLEDGTFFRRIRPFVEGTLWDTFEYRLILALENDQFSTSGLDEFWVGVNYIPIIGTMRAGHVKTPMGLEADMTASSRTMTFLERSSYSEAIELNQNFVTGLWMGNAFLDQRTSYQFAVFRPDQAAATGVFFGDGQWGYQGRLTGLPIWDADGRCFLHLGVSGGWRSGTNTAPGALRTVQLRARPEQRDDDPAGGPGGSQLVPDANDSRMIDTGALVAEHLWITGLEALYVLGPFSVQAEYGWNFVDNVRGVISPGGAGFPPAGSLITFKGAPQNFVFNGGYIQLSYILTGESRGYDKKIGTLSRDYFGGKGPFTNAWFTWDEDRHHLNWGWGAWELAARYSYVDLNDGTGLQRVEGGIMHGFSAGLNWYLNNAVKLQFEYVWDQRSDVPTVATGKQIVTPPSPNTTVPGFIGGLGMRVQVSF